MNGSILLLILIIAFGASAYFSKSKPMRVFLFTGVLINMIVLGILMLGGTQVLGVNMGYLVAHLINLMIIITIFVAIVGFWVMILARGWAFIRRTKSEA